MVMLIVGGSEESFKSKVSTFLLDEFFVQHLLMQ